MRYRIEYLSESTEEESVCAVKLHRGPLTAAMAAGWGDETSRPPEFDGVQIRDMEQEGAIVWLEHFKL